MQHFIASATNSYACQQEKPLYIVRETLLKTHIKFEVVTAVAEDSGLPECKTASGEREAPHILTDHLDPKGKGTTVPQNVINHSSDTAPHLKDLTALK